MLNQLSKHLQQLWLKITINKSPLFDILLEDWLYHFKWIWKHQEKYLIEFTISNKTTKTKLLLYLNNKNQIETISKNQNIKKLFQNHIEKNNLNNQINQILKTSKDINKKYLIFFILYHEEINLELYKTFIKLYWQRDQQITRKHFKQDIINNTQNIEKLKKSQQDKTQTIKYCLNKPWYIYKKWNHSYKLISLYEYFQYHILEKILKNKKNLPLLKLNNKNLLAKQNNLLFFKYKYWTKKQFNTLEKFTKIYFQIMDKINKIHISKTKSWCSLRGQDWKTIHYIFQHHDLHIDNIIFYKKTPIAIDYESLHFWPSFLQPFYFFCTLRSNWNNKIKPKLTLIQSFYYAFDKYKTNKYIRHDIQTLWWKKIYKTIQNEVLWIYWHNTIRNNHELKDFKQLLETEKQNIINYFDNY